MVLLVTAGPLSIRNFLCHPIQFRALFEISGVSAISRYSSGVRLFRDSWGGRCYSASSLYAPAGEIRDRGLENQSYRASGLTLLTAAISLWNTVYIERAIDSLKRKGIPLNEQLISHLSPLGWEHINLSGDYVWRTNLKLGQGKYRSLRSVDSSLYKKQA